jgi:hypothetical protein
MPRNRGALRTAATPALRLMTCEYDRVIGGRRGIQIEAAFQFQNICVMPAAHAECRGRDDAARSASS